MQSTEQEKILDAAEKLLKKITADQAPKLKGPEKKLQGAWTEDTFYPLGRKPRV